MGFIFRPGVRIRLDPEIISFVLVKAKVAAKPSCFDGRKQFVKVFLEDCCAFFFQIVLIAVNPFLKLIVSLFVWVGYVGFILLFCLQVRFHDLLLHCLSFGFHLGKLFRQIRSYPLDIL